MYELTLNADGRQIAIRSSVGTVRFHAIWLRDNAWDSGTRSSGNGQRLITLRDIPVETRIVAAEVTDATLSLTFKPKNETIDYDIAWLMANAYDRPSPEAIGWLPARIETWDSGLMANLPEADFASVKSDQAALKDWLGRVARYGFGKLTNGAAEDQALMQVVGLFGYVRETNYGRHFEVRTQINPTNLAYTGIGLQAHTDNPYRDPVPSVQVFYCLESSAAGGENMVVDGFEVAKRLQQENPKWLAALSGYCSRFEYAGDANVVLRSRRPMIELAPDGELIAVRFNNRSTAAITDVPFDAMETYYAAYRRMGEIIDDPAMEVTFRLSPGESFVVDNTRVLHARKAYSGTGTRWLQGCYADMDGLLSTLAVLESQTMDAAA